MSTTIKSLRKLGLKVNGEEPTNNNIGNVIDEIAENYTGGGSSSGGTQLYKHSIPIAIQGAGDNLTLSIVTDTAEPAETISGATELLNISYRITVDFPGEMPQKVMFADAKGIEGTASDYYNFVLYFQDSDEDGFPTEPVYGHLTDTVTTI